MAVANPSCAARKDQRSVDRQADERMCRGCHKEEGHGETQVEPFPCHGGRSETRSQKDWGSGSRGPKRRRKIGSGQGVSRRTRWTKTIGGRATCQSKGGNLTNITARACQSKDSRTMLPLMVPCWESKAGGGCVGGQWCSLLMTRRRSQCTGCTGQEESGRTLWVKAIGGKSHLTVHRWESEKAQKVGACHPEVSATTSPQTAPCWRVPGRWGAYGGTS